MKLSSQPRKELEKAYRRIEAMNESQHLDEFEDHWRMYLHHLERVWSKSESHFGKSPKWNGWKGRFTSIRKTDPLLLYLRNARGAEEHTVEEITSRTPSMMSINPDSSGNLDLKNLKIDSNKITFESNGPFGVTFTPAKTVLVDITNRGRLYKVPHSHLKQRINPDNVLEIAEKGAIFYENFLNDAEEHFGDRR